MDRTKIKDQFGQFGRRREYGADDDRTTSRQMKKSRRMCAAAAVLFAFAAAFALTTAVYRMDAKAQSDLQRRLSEEVLRFHVLANSDSREDQALKLKVRDKVLEFLEAFYSFLIICSICKRTVAFGKFFISFFKF